ncbi:MAG: hypothetical protein M1840_006479 [Geoglossum simile]|nr:MAG: hypothetical protein M1840_006479 [Geoglossum simile]
MASVGAFFGALSRAVCFALSWICCLPCMVCISVRSRRERCMARRQRDLEASLSTSEPAAFRGIAPPGQWPMEMPYAPVHQAELLESTISFPPKHGNELTPPRKGGLLGGARSLLRKANFRRKIHARSGLAYYSDVSHQERGWEMMLDGSKSQGEVREIYPDLVDEGINSTLCGPSEPAEDLSTPTGSTSFSGGHGSANTAPLPDTKQEGCDNGVALDDSSWVTPYMKDEHGDEIYDVVHWQEDEASVIPTIESPEVPHMTSQIPTTPGGFGNDSSYLPYPLPSLSPSSVGESPANSFYAHDTPQEPTDMYLGVWGHDGLPQMTDGYLGPRGYAGPPQPANPYPGYSPPSLPASHPNEISGVDMPDPNAYIYGPPNPQFPEIPEVPMPDAGHTPSATDPSGISTENSPSGGFSEPDQDGSRFQCPKCLKSYDRKCDLTYESTKSFPTHPYLICTTIASETNCQIIKQETCKMPLQKRSLLPLP